MVVYIVAALIAYAIGSVNFSVIISRKMAGFDVREKGSGNAGTTNMLRSVGKKAAIITLICDILKGVVAIAIAILVSNFMDDINPSILATIAGFFVVVGHTFPIFFEFRGGKGVATALGVLLVIKWQLGLICLVFALLLMALTNMVSLGSLMAAILFPVLTLFITENYIDEIVKAESGNRLAYIIFGIAMAALVLFNHRANLKRILNGTENKLSFKKVN